MRYLIVKLEPNHYGPAFHRVRQVRFFFFQSWLKDDTGRARQFETRAEANEHIGKLMLNEMPAVAPQHD